METETKTHTLEVNGACGPYAIEVTPDELQRIVQVAYDEHGLLAVPSIEREAEAYAAAHPGMCRCGMPGCSDSDQALRDFADRWGQSLRGRA